jgi:8-oxo-dGTP diphosphatase
VSRTIRVVAALIEDGAGRFLIQQRQPGKRRGLLWEFPGGKVEPGETDAQALEREGREELGVELEVGSERHQTRHVYPDLTVQLVILSACIRSGSPAPLGAHALRWATAAEMRGLPFCEADLPFLERLASEASGTLPL